MKNKKQAIFATVALLSLCLVLLVYLYYYKPKMKEAADLASTNVTLQERVNQLKIFNDEMPENLKKISAAETDIKKKLFEFPAEVREEDIIFLALRAAGIKDEDGNNIFPESASANSNSEDEDAPKEGVRYTDIAADPYEEIGVIPVASLKDAQVEGLMAEDEAGKVIGYDIVLNSRKVAYTNLTTYKTMKDLIERINANKEKLAINKVAYAVNKEKGVLEGIIEVTFYSVKGTSKPYKEREFDLYMTGLQDLFKLEGVVELAPGQSDEESAVVTNDDDDDEGGNDED